MGKCLATLIYLCTYHATNRVRPADQHTTKQGVLVASWGGIEALDGELATAMKAMTRRYGYNLDAAMHPQSLSTETFRAGGKG